MTKTINKFTREYRWLSNFWLCPIKINDLIYPSVENAYQASKTKEDRIKFTTCSPSEAKGLGRKVCLRENWMEKRVLIMKKLLIQKFKKNSSLATKLLNTGSAKIIEGNTWRDTYWGVYNGVGENRLGKLIMEIRLSLHKNKKEK